MEWIADISINGGGVTEGNESGNKNTDNRKIMN
jgi:hypothetical protein